MDKTLFPLALFMGCMCIFTATETGFYFTYVYHHTYLSFKNIFIGAIFYFEKESRCKLMMKMFPQCCHLKNSKKKYAHQPIQ